MIAARYGKGPSALALILLIAVQTICVLFFIQDVVEDAGLFGPTAILSGHLLVESLATLTLIVAIALEVRIFLWFHRRQSRVEMALNSASSGLANLVEDYFIEWGLTPAEQDVAAFTLKGYSIAEIAEFRTSREGTIKAHLNAIYRKAGVAGRGQLVSILIEDLMRGALDHTIHDDLKQTSD